MEKYVLILYYCKYVRSIPVSESDCKTIIVCIACIHDYKISEYLSLTNDRKVKSTASQLVYYLFTDIPGTALSYLSQILWIYDSVTYIFEGQRQK